jgi:hypothetical protein
MKFRVPDIVLGALLTVAVFATGMLFASSYQPGPAAKNQSHQTEAAAQDGHATMPIATEHAADSKAAQHKEEKSEFWSAKLTDWLLAVFTLFLVAFTAALVRSTNKLWRAGNQQFELARQEFISSHRPKIIVWGFEFGGDAAGDEPIPVTFRYVNSGDSVALVTEFGSSVFRLSEPVIPTSLQFRHQEIEPPIEVESGMHGFRLTKDTISPAEIIAAGAWPGDKIVCVGYVLYRDRNGTRRQVGFCREFNSVTGRWDTLKDDEYEYSY